MKTLRRFVPLGCVALLISTGSVHAVILYGTGDPAANTSAPPGALAGGGWQYQGQFGAFLGTVIASNYFITAKHIGGSVGQIFTFGGTNYTTTAAFPDPDSDLQIWQIAGAFPVHAPLYTGAVGTEAGLNLIVFGRGTQRGKPVLVGNDSHLGGWRWGNADSVQRWGINVVGSIVLDLDLGRLLRAPFNSSAGTNEAHLSGGDSGGAVFVLNPKNNTWQLAGISVAVDGPFSTSSMGTNPFDAAMFDTTGLFAQGDNGNWMAAPNPSAFYATEIAAHRGWVQSVIMRLTKVISRKIHGSAGTFDIDLPQTGALGIECRTGGAANSYSVVFMFVNNVSVASASITAGTGSVSSMNVAGNVVTLNLTGIVNAQPITVTLANVNNGVNTSDVEARMSVLVADTNGNGTVNSADVAQTKGRIGETLSATNFRSDVNANGAINAGDVAQIKALLGTGLP